MKILVLYAHPVETSFNASLHRIIVERLTAAGHLVDDCDLYAEDFDPRMSRAERLAYHDERNAGEPSCAYVKRLLAAEALVLSFPVWNYGYPAILKGFFDRVFLPAMQACILLSNAAPSIVATGFYGRRINRRPGGQEINSRRHEPPDLLVSCRTGAANQPALPELIGVTAATGLRARSVVSR
jgi:multimeric flavodoxin WrbA